VRRFEQRLGRNAEDHSGHHAADGYERRKGIGADDGDLDDRNGENENGQRKRSELLRKRIELGIDRR
jgi:hypothetical protein